MKNTEIKQLTNKELEERVNDEKNMLIRMKINHTVSPLSNPLKIKYSRRLIAQLKTEIKQREIDGKMNS